MQPDSVDNDKLSAILADIAGEDDPKTQKRDSSWVNPADIRATDSELWSDLIEAPTFPLQVLGLLKSTVLLPRGDFQAPIAASYLMLPSTFCNKIPILVSQGASGSGKSTIAHLACAIHGVEPLGAGSTFPAIRNQIRNNRFYRPEDGDSDDFNEKNCVMAWEDINPQALRGFDGNIFNLLKLGVDRKGKLSIAQVGGKNMEFSVFSPKLISSIHAFYAEHEFRELIRRIIVIEHKKFAHFGNDDFSLFYGDMTPDDLLDLSNINFDGITSEFNNYWMNKDTAQEFARIKKSIRKPKTVEFPSAYFDMSKDLMTTGVVCGFWSSVNDAIEHMAQYFEWHKERIESAATGTEMLLRQLIRSKQELWELNFHKLKEKGQEDFCDPFRLDPVEIKNFLDDKSKTGEIEIVPNPVQRALVMESLGFRLKTGEDDTKNYWYPANS